MKILTLLDGLPSTLPGIFSTVILTMPVIEALALFSDKKIHTLSLALTIKYMVAKRRPLIVSFKLNSVANYMRNHGYIELRNSGNLVMPKSGYFGPRFGGHFSGIIHGYFSENTHLSAMF
ncbi:hypothetical protein ACO0LD_30930 [Undibacterium sp. Ji83W]|uniref:hypothetical protein n=1 Tax=Undibacterium sp. Ji83W TaxID=3413043 RepID=UPI003BF19C7D